MSQPGGRVMVHAAHPPPDPAYEVVVLGGGRMGLLCACALARLRPGLRLLIVERGGIPHEDGATLNAPGVWQRADLPPEWKARAAWTRQVWADPAAHLGAAPGQSPHFEATGWARVGRDLGEPPPGLLALPSPTLAARLGDEAQAQLSSLLDLDRLPEAWLDPLGGAGRAGTLALACGHGAVGLGADLLLNSEAEVTDAGVRVRRLTVTRTHEVVVAETLDLRADQVVVAAGAQGPALLEAALGLRLPHGRTYLQTPRLNVAPAPGLPVLSVGPLTLRPRDGGFQLLPTLGTDRPGAGVQGTTLEGVPTGTRRAVLDQLLAALEDLPALAGPGLDLGRSLPEVPGAWQARPAGGWPVAETLAPGRHLLLGGAEADRTGAAIAYDLAARLAGVSGRPWDGMELDGQVYAEPGLDISE